ncbi:MAG: ferredoxin [Gammaproteobacteria bacterium]|nr:ferredoxin [Gammaproteobacteria bacterium]
MARTLKLDLDCCVNAGECYYNHPRLFAMEDDGAPRLLLKQIETDDDLREAEEAIEVCPSGAITLD